MTEGCVDEFINSPATRIGKFAYDVFPTANR
jgi:hypothetical protein